MLNKDMITLGRQSSVIRELFEYGRERKTKVGENYVFDFSIGNPNVCPPPEFDRVLSELLSDESPIKLYGYTSAPGDISVRSAVAEFLTQRSAVSYTPEHIYMTCGAAAALAISLKAVAGPGDEVILFAPFFPEYRVFVQSTGADSVVCPCNIDDFSIDFSAFEHLLCHKTAAVIVNSPNNPSGVVYSEAALVKLSKLLDNASKRFGHQIFLICDEPYRELVYGDAIVPYVQKIYDDTILCYSFSKSLSLPGERIGYLALSENMSDRDAVFAAICGAGRSLGYVCAPSLFQFAVSKLLGKTSDLSVYNQNRILLCNALSAIGYTVVRPQGAFYLFMKAPDGDAVAFSEHAKRYELLLVPSNDFSLDGYVRISYCVKTETIQNSIPAFKRLFDDYQEKNV